MADCSPARRSFWRNPTFALAHALLLLIGLLGCDGGETDEALTPPTAPPGRFDAEVRGALQATLGGTATARTDTAGRLAGLELNDWADTSRAGLSFELTPLPPVRRRTYTAERQAERKARTPRMNAYLRVQGYAFTARAGSLRVVRTDTAGLRGTFEMTLRGVVDASSDDLATVTVSGSFRGMHVRRTR